MELAALQDLMVRTYGDRDRERGVDATIAWLTEELGELARAVRKGTRADQLHEIGDVLAWVASLTAQLGLSLEDAAARYAGGCPVCGASPCRCPESASGQ
jgi:NTP pyrophosphatase (non-canonical NTP hydrolase)